MIRQRDFMTETFLQLSDIDLTLKMVFLMLTKILFNYSDYEPGGFQKHKQIQVGC